jgi:hypothetical protein
MLKGLVAILLLAAAGAALAERLPLGTMKTQSCRAELYLEISAPQFKRVAEELRFCAERGVQAATLQPLRRVGRRRARDRALLPPLDLDPPPQAGEAQEALVGAQLAREEVHHPLEGVEAE